jgi:beta-carotene 3-hydroxylase
VLTGVLINGLIVVATVVGMEALANIAHRYIMHGPGWGWHKSHHEETEGVFEKNDLYAVVFSVFAVALFAAGGAFWAPLFWVAVGITVYGFLYFVVHDGLVHRRWPFRHNPKHPYLKRLVQAHRLHHATHGREGGVSFGFLYAPPVADLREELRRSGQLEREAAERNAECGAERTRREEASVS